jgi:hypothetical protein
MSLVAAIDLAELPELPPLPNEGVLLLYWDFQGAFGQDAIADCQAYWLPPGVPQQQPHTEEAHIEFATYPVAGARMPIAYHIENAYPVIPDEKDRRRLGEAMSEVEFELYGHQLLGRPREIQGPIFAELAYDLERA